MKNEERLDRWADYFEQELSWPSAGTNLEPTGEGEPWTMNGEPPTASEVYDCICSLKRHRAPGPDDLPPKDRDEVLIWDNVEERSINPVNTSFLEVYIFTPYFFSGLTSTKEAFDGCVIQCGDLPSTHVAPRNDPT
ncbi:hypothetical protein T265_10313 [Opisthorchis viverrini]|uniref:Uncharacterized protein n=1 Tax=Opisthorchis viverrini TaxID=6198 RepID=A0A074ZDR8_OPIVI|nr:hypothetical protein T265_10313 [Opisthorchis viverrini]KER21340.1 hypothetical protein T265_10313 [Opisthorchis viverrini]